MRRVNEWLALKITRGVSTMWCAYLFAALSLVSLPNAIASHDPVILVSWLSQTFLQLVLLSVIMVGQDAMSRRHDEHAARLDDLHTKHDELHETIRGGTSGRERTRT